MGDSPPPETGTGIPRNLLNGDWFGDGGGDGERGRGCLTDHIYIFFDSDRPPTLWIVLPWRKQSWKRKGRDEAVRKSVELAMKLDGLFDAEDM
ncbi:hypothetical protein L3X38_024679 [Prunus dulcis]|uniref:Uncharacterized protein n=1 Tax=Prunus dulcis TaxID=3755 RepID=A0AAD4W2T1_PRUDU|nr:hypothetical protein L3X38_024679 [Prunus dulcis]